jgi:hypothetical protein
MILKRIHFHKNELVNDSLALLSLVQLHPLQVLDPDELFSHWITIALAVSEAWDFFGLHRRRSSCLQSVGLLCNRSSDTSSKSCSVSTYHQLPTCLGWHAKFCSRSERAGLEDSREFSAQQAVIVLRLAEFGLGFNRSTQQVC